MQLFQGDISIIKIDNVPQNIEFKEVKEDTIVAYGEKSGHKHTLTTQERKDVSYKIAQVDGGFYLITDTPIVLTHNQHKTQTIDVGTWWIGKQFEYDEIEKLKQVRD